MKPIISSTKEVQAILAGRKTQTRRIMKPQITDDGGLLGSGCWFYGKSSNLGISWDKKNDVPKSVILKAPYQKGDILWVREPWADIIETAPGNIHYQACATVADLDWFRENGWKWRNPIYMPKEAARIFLRVTDVRVERVQSILCGDMKAEGVIPPTVRGGQWQQWQRDYFAPKWNKLNAKRGYGWYSNPWVFVYSFDKTTKEEAHAQDD